MLLACSQVITCYCCYLKHTCHTYYVLKTKALNNKQGLDKCLRYVKKIVPRIKRDFCVLLNVCKKIMLKHNAVVDIHETNNDAITEKIQKLDDYNNNLCE